eukprot:SAG11_NODE_36087_length_263_cov_0.939024_1_plen_40_part_10
MALKLIYVSDYKLEMSLEYWIPLHQCYVETSPSADWVYMY